MRLPTAFSNKTNLLAAVRKERQKGTKKAALLARCSAGCDRMPRLTRGWLVLSLLLLNLVATSITCAKTVGNGVSLVRRLEDKEGDVDDQEDGGEQGVGGDSEDRSEAIDGKDNIEADESNGEGTSGEPLAEGKEEVNSEASDFKEKQNVSEPTEHQEEGGTGGPSGADTKPDPKDPCIEADTSCERCEEAAKSLGDTDYTCAYQAKEGGDLICQKIKKSDSSSNQGDMCSNKATEIPKQETKSTTTFDDDDLSVGGGPVKFIVIGAIIAALGFYAKSKLLVQGKGHPGVNSKGIKYQEV